MHIIFQQKALLRTSSCREWVVNIKFLTKYSWTLPHCGPSLFYHGMILVFLFLSENVPAIIPAMLMKWVNLNHMIKIRFFSSHHFLLFLFFLSCILDYLSFSSLFFQIRSHLTILSLNLYSDCWILSLAVRRDFLSYPNTCDWVGGQLKAYNCFRWSLIAIVTMPIFSLWFGVR